MTEMNIYREIEYFIWKIHKEQQHLIFLDKCRAEDIFPEFSKVDHKTYKKLHLQPHNAKKIETNIFNFEYQKHTDNLTSYKHNLNYLFHECSKFNPHANITFSIIKSKIQFSENFNDMNREKKFKIFSNLKSMSTHLLPLLFTI